LYALEVQNLLQHPVRGLLRDGQFRSNRAGQPAVSTGQIVSLTLSKRPGDKVNIGYQRNGTAATAALTLTAQPSAS
jgi:S1-C subfamily serine protease